jgi:hypothetical protein
MKTLAVSLSIPVLSLALFGCATMEGTVQTRASNDMKCPEERIAVANIGGTSYRATGCGQEATYNCMQSTQQGAIACVREEQKAKE